MCFRTVPCFRTGNESERRAYYAKHQSDANVGHDFEEYCSPSGLEPTVKHFRDPLQDSFALF
jgi:hypothetical protein